MRSPWITLFPLLAVLSVAELAGQTVPPGTAPPDAASQAPTGRGRGGRGGPPRVPFIPDAPTLGHRIVENALVPPPELTFGVVPSVAVNSQGHVFVYHRGATPVLEFDQNGVFVRGLREGTATRAHSIRIDAQDNLWLVDSGDHTVTKLSPAGDVLLTLGTRGVVGTGDADAAQQRFNIPSDVGFGPNGDIFIAQGEAGGPDPRVIRFDRTGQFLTTWTLAYAQGIRSNPHAIEVDSRGLVYVADREVMRIRVFQPDGTPVRDIQMQNPVCGIFIDRNQQLWVATGADGQLLQVDESGKVQGFAGRRGTGPGEMTEAHMLAVAPNGDVYVADSVGRKVVKFQKPTVRD
jgi:peptidylamidoglycolate lyase